MARTEEKAERTDVNLSVSEADREFAEDWVKTHEKGKKAEEREDFYFTGKKRGTFGLCWVRARREVAKGETEVAGEGAFWLPSIANSSIADFVTYFNHITGDGEYTMKARAFNQELVTIRGALKRRQLKGRRSRVSF